MEKARWREAKEWLIIQELKDRLIADYYVPEKYLGTCLDSATRTQVQICNDTYRRNYMKPQLKKSEKLQNVLSFIKELEMLMKKHDVFLEGREGIEVVYSKNQKSQSDCVEQLKLGAQYFYGQ